jgi:hypothetical protein
MDNTIIQSGRIVSTGAAQTLAIRSDIDWMETYNYTRMTDPTQWNAVAHKWYRGMAVNDGIAYYHAAATVAMDTGTCATGWNGAVYDGFTLINTYNRVLGAPVATTGITAANPPLVTTGATAGLNAVTSIVRLTNTLGTLQYAGMDWTVGVVVLNTSFQLAHAPQPVVSAGAGQYRIVNVDLAWYPQRRWITNITQAANAVITTSVTNTYTVGQQVRFIVPAAFGMIEMNGLTGTVIAVNQVGTTGNNTLTVNIDSTGFTPFAFPLTGVVPFTSAEVVPVGMDTASALSLGADPLSGAELNQGILGMRLGAGVGSPLGQANDVIYWKAGKSFNL